MLNDEELRTLIAAAHQGDLSARERIIEENLNLVRSVAHRFSSRGYEWEDLFQIGCIGLIKAAERFDLGFGVRFSTYAVPMIIGEIRRFMRDDHPVKVSRPLKDAAYRIHKTQEELQGALGREPTLQEVAEKIAMAPQEVVAALEAAQPPVSIYEPAAGSDQLTLLDQLKDDQEMEGAQVERLHLREVMEKELSEKERRVVLLRFFQDKTQAEAARRIGVSQVQVSRIEKQALKRLRTFL